MAEEAVPEALSEGLHGLKRDIEGQMRRMKKLIEADTSPTGEDVLRTIYDTVLPLMLDHVGFTDRLEQHAEWASDEIENLGGGEVSSRLTKEDAGRYRDYIAAVLRVCDASLAAAPEESEQATQLKILRESSLELQQLTDDIELLDDNYSGAVDGSAQDAAPEIAPAIDAPTGALPLPAGVVSLPDGGNGQT